MIGPHPCAAVVQCPFSVTESAVIVLHYYVLIVVLVESLYVLSAIDLAVLIGNGKCKQLSDWSELELSTVLDSCALRNLSVFNI